MNDVIVYFSLIPLIYLVKPTAANLSNEVLFVQFLKGLLCWFTLPEINTNEEMQTKSRKKIGLLWCTEQLLSTYW